MGRGAGVLPESVRPACGEAGRSFFIFAQAGSALATLTVQSAAVSGAAPIPTSIEQFDLQDAETSMWGYDEGWQEAESSPALGVWRWTSERSTLRIVGPPRAVEITLRIESPLRYFDEPPVVRIRAGDREIAVATVGVRSGVDVRGSGRSPGRINGRPDHRDQPDFCSGRSRHSGGQPASGPANFFNFGQIIVDSTGNDPIICGH